MIIRITAIEILILLIMCSHAMGQPVPDTGQNNCYGSCGVLLPVCPSPGEKYYGQDANYYRNPMSYTKLGLDGDPLPDTAKEWAMVKDNVTGLVWEVKTSENMSARFDWDKAKAYAADLNLGGFSDWRLPSITELAYLVDHSVNPNSIPQPGPMLNNLYFPNTGNFYYWSSTTKPGSIGSAFNYNFSQGSDNTLMKSSKLSVRAVRSDIDVKTSLHDNADGTVTNINSSLMWQKETYWKKMSWIEALNYCEKTILGGKSDWRVPNIKELRSLVDYNNFNPTINSLLQAGTEPSNYWSSTSKEGEAVKAKAISFYRGSELGYDKNEVFHVRCVRDAFNDLQKADIVFNWLELEFPQILFPAPQQTLHTDGVYYRWYPGINVAIGTIDNVLYYLDESGTLYDLGKTEIWLPYAY